MSNRSHHKIIHLNVGRFRLLKLKVPVLVSRNAVPQATAQGQAENICHELIRRKRTIKGMLIMRMIWVSKVRMALAPSEGGKASRGTEGDVSENDANNESVKNEEGDMKILRKRMTRRIRMTTIGTF